MILWYKKTAWLIVYQGNNKDYTMKYLFTFLYFVRITQFAIFPEPFWIASIYSFCYIDVRYVISLAVTIIQPTNESFRLLMSWLEWITWNTIFRGRLVYLQVSVSINKQKSLLIYLYLNFDVFLFSVVLRCYCLVIWIRWRMHRFCSYFLCLSDL